MKVITNITVRTGKLQKRGDKEILVTEDLAPGEQDLDDKLAKQLIARGQAVTPADAAKAAKAEGPTVTKAAEKPGKQADKAK